MNCRICGAPLPEGAMFCGECGSSTSATVQTRSRAETAGSDTTIVEPLEPAVDGGTHAQGPTRPVPGFVLRFSTGEVATVRGTGLIGRRPMPQPAESFDQLVYIDDRGLSVSKTHLEFGQHEGALWIADRFSGNGTLIRGSDGSIVRCEPGRRYVVGRGARVDMGEQSFTIE